MPPVTWRTIAEREGELLAPVRIGSPAPAPAVPRACREPVGANGQHPLPPWRGAGCDGPAEAHIIRALEELGGDWRTSGELRDILATRGVHIGDPKLRSLIAHLVRDHLRPIVSGPRGFALVADTAAVEQEQAELRSRIREMQARVDALDEVKAVLQGDTGPIARRLGPDGMPRFSHAEKRRRKQTRVDELVQEAAKRAPAPDALEWDVSRRADELGLR